MNFNYIAIILFLLLSTFSFAVPNEQLEQADQQFKLGNYKEALALYNEIEPKDLHVHEHIANCYYHLNQYTNAEEALAKVIDVKGVSSETILHYAEVLMNQQKYAEAAMVLERYSSESDVRDVSNKSESCSWAPAHLDDRPRFRLHQTNIETGGRSLGVAKYKDGLIYAYPQEDDFKSSTVYYNLVFAKQQDTINFGTRQELPKELSTKYYEGSPSVSSDGKWLYFTRNASKKKVVNVKKKEKNNISDEGINVLQLMRAQNVQGEWTNVSELPVNSIEYSSTHPSMAADGKTLYFVSNMPGGQGGFDIYKMTLNSIGEWSDPVNLGANVNTKGHEMFPHYFDGTLYFASNGGVGFGGFDIYTSSDSTGEFQIAQNAGIGLNSSKDDFAIVMNEDGESGYISSNREGENGYDRVFYFNKIIYPFTVNAFVKDKVSTKPIKGALIDIHYKSGNQVLSEKTNEQGHLSFELYPTGNYIINFSKEGYEPETLEIPAGTPKDSIVAMLGNMEMGIEAKKDVVINLDNIYFGLDQAEPLPESLPILDRLVSFMKEHPEVKIELSAHTDSRGGNGYNRNLSDRRANACFNYLVSNDIDKKRIVPKGYGESKLLNECADGVYCSEDKHQKNRRVEIKIL